MGFAETPQGGAPLLVVLDEPLGRVQGTLEAPVDHHQFEGWQLLKC